MAANMQHMAGAGQMMPQQMRKPTNNQLQQIVYQNLVQHTQPFTGICWQANVPIGDRMGKTMNLISNIALAMNGVDSMKAAEFGCGFERDVFHKSPTKEVYDTEMTNKIMDFYKKRQQNEPNLQNALNANAQAQAQAQAHQAQAQAMMNMQAQMGRGGMGQGPQQGFHTMQNPMQAGQMSQQQQMGIGMGMNMGIGMGMPNQAGRGISPNQQMIGMPGNQARPQQGFPNELSRLSQQDKGKVAELAARMMSNATEQMKSNTRLQLQQRLPPQQLAEFQANGKDPLLWFYQSQAFQVLKANMNRLNPQNANAQAALMQQQQSQQSLQRQQQGQQAGMMNGTQNGNDFSQFTPNMESIKDQQMNGIMAQQSGQTVVPASNVPNRNPTPQPMGQNLSNQGPNQARPAQQQQPQSQPQQGLNLQQMKMNQQSQQALQAQAQMKQMQNQPGMNGNMPPSQSPGMNTLNTPVSRPPNNMNPMGNQNMGQGNVQFGDQRFNQGSQRPNNQAFQSMLQSLNPEQRSQVSGMPPEKLNEVMQRWQTHRREQMAMNGGQGANQIQRTPSQMGQMGAGQMGAGLQQPGAQGNAGQQIGMQRAQNAQAIAMMDAMDLPAQVLSQLAQIPQEVKKWGALKLWLGQNNVAQHVRTQLSAIQQKQFSLLLQKRNMMPGQQGQGQQPQQPQPQQPPLQAQPNQQQSQPQNPQQNQQPQSQQGQNANMPMGMPTSNPQGPNAQQAMARQLANIPQQLLQVSAQDLMHVRSQRPNLANVPDEQLRMMVVQMKKQSWLQQQQMRGQATRQVQQPGQNQVPAPQPTMQIQQQQPQPTQPNQTPQPPNMQAPNTIGQNNAMQGGVQKQANATPTPEQMRNARPQTANRAQPPNPSPAPATKNLKRPSTDENADVGDPSKPANQARPPSQPNQQQLPIQKGLPNLTPQQIASLTPEQRAKYEQFVKLQMSRAAAGGAGQMGAPAENMARLKAIGQEAQRQSVQEAMVDIHMSPEEHRETANKLQRIVLDMSKIGKGLSRWYSITRDDQRAKMFFRTRLRIIKQFADGENMSLLKDMFSIRSNEIDQARAMLESMAKDLAASMYMREMMIKNGQQQTTPQPPNAQPPQQQQSQQQNQTLQQQPAQGNQPAPLNAANLEKNSQALNKANQKPAPKAQTPVAPTTAQPPFQFGASSPHGNPSYGSKIKDMNLQIPQARKKQKVSGQTPQGATPSPQISKKASPEMRRASEPQVPQKPIFVCKESDCEMSAMGFPTEQALQSHFDEDHVKPKADPMKFMQENLALALGLEADGTPKKVQESAPAMGMTNSKQGQTPANLAVTPASTDAAMKGQVKGQDGKVNIKSETTPKPTDAKLTEAPATTDPWASSTIDPQSLMSNLGLDNGYRNVISDINVYRSLTPNDTPESSKDSGSSEPNSDISEGVSLEIDAHWQNLDTDLLINMNSTNLDGAMGTMDGFDIDLDPSLLDPSGPPPDWEDVNVDFTKPFQLDTSYYSMET